MRLASVSWLSTMEASVKTQCALAWAAPTADSWFASDVGDSDAGVRLVAAVHADQVGGERLDVVSVA